MKDRPEGLLRKASPSHLERSAQSTALSQGGGDGNNAAAVSAAVNARVESGYTQSKVKESTARAARKSRVGCPADMA